MVNQFTRQKKLIILPDDVLSWIKNEAVFKVTASTWRRAGVSHPLVANDFHVNFHYHFYFILSKHNYCLGVYSKSEKSKRSTLKKACYKPLYIWSVYRAGGSFFMVGGRSGLDKNLGRHGWPTSKNWKRKALTKTP